MDKRFLYSNFMDSDSKLTRATSLSELSDTNKVIEQQCRSETCGNLVKQFSCEQIFGGQPNTSHLNKIHTSTVDNEQHTNNWNTRTPSFIVLQSFKNSRWLSNENESLKLHKQLSLPTQYQKFRGVHDMDSKRIITLPKLIDNDNESKLLSNIMKNNGSNYNGKSDNKLLNESILKLKNTSLLDQSNDSITRNVGLVHETDFIEDIKVKNVFKKENNESVELKKEMQKRKKLIFFKYLFLPICVAFLIYILTSSNLLDDLCNPRFNLNKVSEELKNHIYGQDEAINILTKHFRDIQNQTELDVIILVGGIGVGKSYTAEIIKNTLKDTMKLNNLDLFPPLYNKEDKTLISLSVCRCNLIRLENLKTDDVLDAVHFINNLKMKFPSYCILVLTLFNTEEIDYYLKRSLDLNKSVIMIRENFEKINLQTTIVKFQPLSNEALMECIKDAAKHANVNLSDNEANFVMNDLIAANSGCKGAYAKVQIVGKKARKSSN